MPNLTPAQAIKEASTLASLWQQRLLLNEWRIDFHTMGRDEETEGSQTLMDCSPDPVYMMAKVRIFPAYGTKDKDMRELALVHELCHLLTQEARDLVNRSRMENNVTAAETTSAIERLTQRIANVALGQHLTAKRPLR